MQMRQINTSSVVVCYCKHNLLQAFNLLFLGFVLNSLCWIKAHWDGHKTVGEHYIDSIVVHFIGFFI